MSINENAVAKHYGVADLGRKILDGLKATGKDLDNLTTADLAVIDEFHIGGRDATCHAVSKLGLVAEEMVLDVGSGIGGPARTMAEQAGCKVTGIDLTAEYVEIAQTLSHLTGLQDQTEFRHASALSMPFESETFDAALTMHVAMNIADRNRLYCEIARVLKPGARFCAYDVMKKNDKPIDFPVPWAQTPETSHLATPDEMSTFLMQSGFKIVDVEDRSEFAFEYFDKRLAASSNKPAPLGPHLVMGPTARQKFENTYHNMKTGRIAPVLMVAVRT